MPYIPGPLLAGGSGQTAGRRYVRVSRYGQDIWRETAAPIVEINPAI